MLQEVLSLFQLEEYFDHLISAEHLPYSKPHPDVYLRAAQALNSDPLDCVTLEDSFNGMIAAKAARMRSIVVPAAICFDDPRWALADVKLPSLAQLKRAIYSPDPARHRAAQKGPCFCVFIQQRAKGDAVTYCRIV